MLSGDRSRYFPDIIPSDATVVVPTYRIGVTRNYLSHIFMLSQLRHFFRFSAPAQLYALILILRIAPHGVYSIAPHLLPTYVPGQGGD